MGRKIKKGKNTVRMNVSLPKVQKLGELLKLSKGTPANSVVDTALDRLIDLLTGGN
jgi:hypothetical protein